MEWDHRLEGHQIGCKSTKKTGLQAAQKSSARMKDSQPHDGNEENYGEKGTTKRKVKVSE